MALSIIGLKEYSEESLVQGKATIVIKTLGKTTLQNVSANGRSLYEILDKHHDLEVQFNGISASLLCIDQVCAKNGFWWQLYVNDKLVLKTIDTYFPKKGDKIILEYGEKT